MRCKSRRAGGVVKAEMSVFRLWSGGRKTDQEVRFLEPLSPPTLSLSCDSACKMVCVGCGVCGWAAGGCLDTDV